MAAPLEGFPEVFLGHHSLTVEREEPTKLKRGFSDHLVSEFLDDAQFPLPDAVVLFVKDIEVATENENMRNGNGGWLVVLNEPNPEIQP